MPVLNDQQKEFSLKGNTLHIKTRQHRKVKNATWLKIPPENLERAILEQFRAKVYKEISKEVFNIRFSTHSRDTEGNAKECSNYHTTALVSYASKVMLKILQARLQQ